MSGFIGASISSAFLVVVGLFNAFGVYTIMKSLQALKRQVREGDDDDGDGDDDDDDDDGDDDDGDDDGDDDDNDDDDEGPLDVLPPP